MEEYRRKRAGQACVAAPARPAGFIGGNLRAPHKLKDVKPVYPESMRAAGIAGDVVLNARIAKDGLVDGITVVSTANPALSDAAIQAVTRWEFDSVLLNCMPTEARMVVHVRFALEP